MKTRFQLANKSTQNLPVLAKLDCFLSMNDPEQGMKEPILISAVEWVLQNKLDTECKKNYVRTTGFAA